MALLKKGRYQAFLQQPLSAEKALEAGIPGTVVGIQFQFNVVGLGLVSPLNMRVCAILEDGSEFDYTNTMTIRDKADFPREMASMLTNIPDMIVTKLK